jgi:hypothetical protein
MTGWAAAVLINGEPELGVSRAEQDALRDQALSDCSTPSHHPGQGGLREPVLLRRQAHQGHRAGAEPVRPHPVYCERLRRVVVGRAAPRAQG